MKGQYEQTPREYSISYLYFRSQQVSTCQNLRRPFLVQFMRIDKYEVSYLHLYPSFDCNESVNRVRGPLYGIKVRRNIRFRLMKYSRLTFLGRFVLN